MIKNYKLQIAIRLSTLSITIGVAIYCILVAKLYFSFGACLIVFAIQLYMLFNFMDKTNRMISAFFSNIRFSDYNTQSSLPHKSKTLNELQESMNMVMKKVESIQKEKELQYHFLQYILQHVQIGIVVYNTNGKIELSNRKFHQLLKTPIHKHISELQKDDEEMYLLLKNIESTKRQLFKIVSSDMEFNYSVLNTNFILNGEKINLVSFQNIQPELDQNEIASWQKLTSVLTHEIMNSITPISSLSGTIASMLPENGESFLAGDLEDITTALSTIGSRSKGLIEFVERYRTITKVPIPNMEEIPATQLIEELAPIVHSEIGDKNIEFNYRITSPNIVFIFDKNQIQQVLINLVKNGIQSMENGGELTIIIDEEPNQAPSITVKDSGKGISKEIMDKIFIPFYTTKPTGSGIGLSLAKQIMQMHGGCISVKSVPEKGSSFILQF